MSPRIGDGYGLARRRGGEPLRQLGTRDRCRAGVEQNSSADDLALQALFDARCDFGQRWFVDAGIRYLYASAIDMAGVGSATDTITADYGPFSLTLGIIRRF